MGKSKVYTIGHSNHSFANFLSLLKKASVSLVIDVRSSPVSRVFPHFNAQVIEASLISSAVQYEYEGHRLGGRPLSADLYRNCNADYEKMALTKDFARGILQVLEAAKILVPALMCSEKDPLNCHRCLLVGKHLSSLDVEVVNLLADGSQECQRDTEVRMMRAEKCIPDLITTHEEMVDEAYRRRNKRVGYKVKCPS